MKKNNLGIKFLLSIIAVMYVTTVVVIAISAVGYKADESVKIGSLVSVSDDSSKVELASIENQDNFAGVVINRDVIDTTNISNQTVYVASSGVVRVLVTDYDGDIEKGDKLGISVIDGVASKTEESGIGYALESFNSRTPNSTNISSQVNKTGTWMGEIEMQLADTPNTANTDWKSIIESSGVPAWRITLSIIVFLGAITIAATILHGSVEGGMISLGRNPLSKKIISKGMLFSLGLGAGSVGVAVILIYIILNI